MTAQRLLYRMVVIMVLAVLIGLGSPGPAAAAAPRLIMVSGPSLPRPIWLTDWGENGEVLGIRTSTITPGELAGRPYLDLGLYWTDWWERYLYEGRLDELQHEPPSQHGRLYPALDDGDAFIVLNTVPPPGTHVNRVTPEGAAILTRHGIPVRWDANMSVQTAAQATSPNVVGRPTSSLLAENWRWLAGGGILLLAGAIAGARLIRRRRRMHFTETG